MELVSKLLALLPTVVSRLPACFLIQLFILKLPFNSLSKTGCGAFMMAVRVVTCV